MALRFLLALAARCALVLTAAAALGYGFILLSQAIDDDAAVKARAIAAAEDPAFAAAQVHRGAWHFSESYAVSMLLHESGRQTPLSAVEAWVVTWMPPKRIWENLRDAARDLDAARWQTYERYWHGSLALHRLGLSGMDYRTFALACAGAMLAGLALLALAVGRACGGWAAAAGAAIAAILYDFAPMLAAPTLTISIAALATCGAALFLFARRASAPGLSVAVFAAGAAYNYFDFLYYPGVLAALAAAAASASAPARPAWPPAAQAVWFGLGALAGYAAMWIAKWTLAVAVVAIYGGDAGSPVTLWNFSRWIAGGDMGAPVGAATLAALERLRSVNGYWVWAAGAVGAAALTAAVARGRPAAVAAAAIPGSLALGLTEAMSGHTITHAYFSYGNAAFALALTAALWAAQATQGSKAAATPRMPSR